MDSGRTKRASHWYYGTVFREEAIQPRVEPAAEKLPPLLRTARSLENGPDRVWQSRESVFLKQAKLLVNYEDDYVFSGNVVRYFPTYAALTDRELRGYFSWRTQVRRGNVKGTSLSFAFLYIYELINQIGVRDPMEGYEMLRAFRDVYGGLDGSILPYLEQWLADYVVYYGLDSGLLRDSKQCIFDRNILVLRQVRERQDVEVMEAVKALAPKWLARSKFYGSFSADCDRVIAAVLRQVADHYEKHTKKTMAEHYFGKFSPYPIRLFDTAVFCDPLKQQSCEYTVDPVCVYRCQWGLWTVTRYPLLPNSGSKLEDLLKTVDAIMRELYGYKYPVKQSLDIKWLVKIIREETETLLREKKAAEAKKLSIDYAKLARIRQEAAVTQEKLTVEEEPEAVPAPAAAPEDPLLPQAEYRLLQCLLYDRPLEWVRAEGHILSVLLDSINDKLYDSFQDAVVSDTPAVLEDYREELKEMVMP